MTSNAEASSAHDKLTEGGVRCSSAFPCHGHCHHKVRGTENCGTAHQDVTNSNYHNSHSTNFTSSAPPPTHPPRAA